MVHGSYTPYVDENRDEPAEVQSNDGSTELSNSHPATIKKRSKKN
jgi:hypothetical protein